MNLFVRLPTVTNSLVAGLVAQALLLAPLSHADQGLHYLNSTSIDVATFPPPPVAGSAPDKADLDVVRGYQKTRTQGQCKYALTAAALNAELFKGPLTAAEVIKFSPLFAQVFSDTDYFVNTIKPRFQRQRPYVRDPKIKLCFESMSHPALAYPSGHSAISRAAALVLGLIYPKRAAAIIQLSDRIALSRVIAGVHHPKDIEAGKKLGDMVFAAMKNNAEFQKRIAELKSKGNTK